MIRLLIDKKGKKYLAKDNKIQTHLGVVELENASPGSIVTSHLGNEFYVLKPRICDIYDKMERAGSVILKKDIGLILAYTSLGSGDIVVDAGVGSGGLAIYLANIVKPKGKVYAYEIREDHAEIARNNIKLAGLEDYVEIKIKDVRKGIDEEADLITLDIPDPWEVAEHAYNALKHSGYVVAYSPYIEQARKANLAFREAGLKEVKTIELIEREIEVASVGTRPRTRMVGHTGYLTLARKY